MDSRPRPLLLVAVVALAGLTVTGCASTTKHCSTVEACSAAGSAQFGQAVLTPRRAIFVRGSIENGVLTIDFRDPPSGPAYKEFVGRPKTTPHCPGPLITASATRRFCYAPTNTELVAHLTVGTLVYVVSIAAPPPSLAASDRAVITRIVSSLS